MKRLPLALSFLLFILLCASIAYWGMQLFKPPLRPVAAPPRATQPEVQTASASSLFGARSGPGAVASNYQLRGVIFSGNPRDSVAIVSADGKPPQAIRVNSEVVPGVMIKEVHPGYVVLSENGATKRVELPESAKDTGLSTVSPVGTSPAEPGAGRGTPTRAQAAASGQPQPAPGPITAPAPPQQPAFAPPPQQPLQAPASNPPGALTPTPGTATATPPAVPGVTAPPTVVVSPPPSVQSGTTVVPPNTIPTAPAQQPYTGRSTVPGTAPLQSR